MFVYLVHGIIAKDTFPKEKSGKGLKMGSNFSLSQPPLNSILLDTFSHPESFSILFSCFSEDSVTSYYPYNNHFLD